MDFEYCIISLQTKTNRQKVVTNMKFKIGFTAEQTKNNNTMTANCERKTQTEIRRSVVQVYFPQRHMELAYYNDMFDLKNGDLVYVDGKLEGMLGRVTDVNYTFKIKVSDYKRVISVVDTNINGTLYFAGSNFVAFDRDVLPKTGCFHGSKHQRKIMKSMPRAAIINGSPWKT